MSIVLDVPSIHQVLVNTLARRAAFFFFEPVRSVFDGRVP